MKTTQERIEELRRRREQARTADPQASERQRARGKLTARERVDALLDPNSFVVDRGNYSDLLDALRLIDQREQTFSAPKFISSFSLRG